MIASPVGAIRVARHPHLFQRDRLYVQADISDEVIKITSCLWAKTALNDDGRLSGSRSRMAISAEVSTTISEVNPARHSR